MNKKILKGVTVTMFFVVFLLQGITVVRAEDFLGKQGEKPSLTSTPSNTSTSSTNSGGVSTQYTPMEKIPGTSSATDFPSYVKAIYKFGIWTIGIAAMLMIMIGGFMYITSAGNNATMGKAKGYITDALIGLVMAMTAYLLLNTINPDLVNIKIKFPSGSGGGAGTGNIGTGGTGLSSTTIAKGCTSEVDSSLSKAASANGLDENYMKAIVKCGEGCNANKSPAGACGFGQVIDGPYSGKSKLTWNRCKICGIVNPKTGQCDQNYSCQAVQDDRNLDMNCSALVIKDAQKKPGCGVDLSTLARCYNGGNINANNTETNNYVNKVTNCK